MPAWTAEATDTAYEEIGSGSSLPIPDDIKLDEKVEHAEEVGRWGEMLVYNYLKEQQKGKNTHTL